MYDTVNEKDQRKQKIRERYKGTGDENLDCIPAIPQDEYSRAAEPPVRCGESHMSGLTGATLL